MMTNKVAGARIRVGLGAIVVVAVLVQGAVSQEASAARVPFSPAPELAWTAAASTQKADRGAANTPAMTPAQAFQSPDLQAQPPAAWGALLSTAALLLVGLNVAFLTHLRRAYASPRRGARGRG